MSETSFDVQIWKTDVYQGKKTTTYWVRWAVAGERQKEPFKTSALAESFRSELVTAARKGEAFYVDSGRPVSMQRIERDLSWYELACNYVDRTWDSAAGTTRRTNAEALTRITVKLLKTEKGKPDDKLIRHALNRWAFNKHKRDSPDCPPHVKSTLRWIEKSTHKVSALVRPELLRPVLDGLTRRLDGKPSAATVVNRHRIVLNAVVNYAVELKALGHNPIPALKWDGPAISYEIDRRSVPNPVQARTLLNAVREYGRIGPRLVAFFACLYFAGLRPEEAVALKKENLSLPEEGWGELIFGDAEPHAGREWTDTGTDRDRRQLKHRAVGRTRTVPCPPELTALLHWHITTFGLTPEGRLFRGERKEEELPKITISRCWHWVRGEVFAPDVRTTDLAKTPYHLRAACVSLWLVAGVPPATVAKWAGHSIEILYRIYAAWLANSEKALRGQIEQALGIA